MTGLVFIAVVIGSILGGPYAFAGVFMIFTYLGVKEFYDMVRLKDKGPSRNWGLVSGIALYIMFAYAALDHSMSMYLLIALMIPVFLLPLIIELKRKKEQPVVNVAINTIGMTYIALPFALLNFINSGPLSSSGSSMMIGFFTLIWINDTGAFVVGSLIGKHKLAPTISPNKTIEGFMGSVVFTLAAAWVIATFIVQENLLLWMATGAIIVAFGTLGDLVESMLKRSYGVKDAGTLLPGHGGVLDRFDGVLLAGPAVLSLFYWVESI